MTTQSAKFSRKKQLFLAAMLTARTIGDACQAVSISESTGYRWWKDTDFQARFKEMKAALVERAIAKLQHASFDVAAALYDIALDDTQPTSARVSAGRTILEYMYRGNEVEQILERIEALEEAMGLG